MQRPTTLAWLALACSALFVAYGCGGPSGSQTARLRPALEALDELKDPYGAARLYANSFRMFSSADRGDVVLHPVISRGNMDFGVFERDCRAGARHDPIHFTVRSHAGCPPGIEGLVLAHAAGAGTVSRIWLTARDAATEQQWQDERLRIYLDGESEPIVDESLSAVAAGAWPFVTPYGGVRSGSLVTYLPIAFGHELWITLSGARTKLYYYQVDVVTGELPVASRGMRRETLRVRSDPITTHTVLYTGEGAGGITAIELRAAAGARETLRNGRLAFAFDGVTSAASVGDLCVAGFAWGRLASTSGRVVVDGEPSGGVRCALRWGWPHAVSGSVTLIVADPRGITATVAAAEPGPPMPEGRFFVSSATHAVSVPRLLTWADLEGDGRLAGLVVSAEGAPDPDFFTPDPLNFLEGDEVIQIDGAVAAYGTGTEDLFNGGFYFRDGAYSWPWGGVSLVGAGPGDWGRAQMVRYFLGADQVRFRESFLGTLEIGGDRPEIDHHYRSSAVFYVRPPGTRGFASPPGPMEQ